MFRPAKSKLNIFFLILMFFPLILMRMIVYPITFEAPKGEIIKNLEKVNIADCSHRYCFTAWVNQIANYDLGFYQVSRGKG